MRIQKEQTPEDAAAAELLIHKIEQKEAQERHHQNSTFRGRFKDRQSGRPHRLPASEWGNEAIAERTGPRRRWSRNRV
jgi:hypothetical protein